LSDVKVLNEVGSHYVGAFLMYSKTSELLVYSKISLKGGTIMYIYVNTLSIHGGIAIAFFIIGWWWYKNK